MERVQITGGGNGIYTDTKGRRLYTMGDYSPAVGAWVWTNGTTIYGHQSAGNALCCNIDDACLPYTCWGEVGGENGGYADQLADLSSNKGKIDAIIPARIAAYAGDKNHAYVGLRGDYKGMKWFNVLTGEYLGNFTPDDACIDKKGNLVTIEHQDGVVTYRDQIVENNIELFSASSDVHIPIEKESFDTEPESEITISQYDTPVREIYKIVRRDNVEEIDPFVLIRVNGKVVKRIDKRSGFIGEGLLEAEKSTIAIINDVDASGDATGSERSNVPYSAKPPSGINCIYLYMNNIKVYPDLNCSMNISFSVSASAYPFISTDSIDFSGNGEYSITYEYSDDAPQSPEAKRYFDFLKNSWKENPQCYTHKVKIKLIGLRTGRYKDWITINIDKSIQISVECGGRIIKNYASASVSIRNRYLLIVSAVFDHNVWTDGTIPSKNGILLGKYNLHYIASWPDTFTYEITHSHQGFKNFPMAIVTLGGIFTFPRAEHISKSAWNGQSYIYKQTPFSEEEKIIPVQTNYNIGNGFSIALELRDKYYIGSVQSFKLYYHGKFVINSFGTQLQYLASSWINIRATALSNDRFLISCTNLSMPPLIVEHGKAKVMSNIAYSYINYTLANFKNKKRLKSSLKNLLKTL